MRDSPFNVIMKKIIRERYLELLEVFLWFFLPLLYFVITDRTTFVNYNFLEDLDKTFKHLFTSIFICFFVIIFRLIFLRYPFQFLREKFLGIRSVIIEDDERSDVVKEKNISIVFLENCVRDSEKIAENILSHSRLHLFLGCTLALGGLGLFCYFIYNQQFTPDINILLSNMTNIWDGLLRIFVSFLPKFGVLFFVEYIAIFFLRQYKKLQDEYKYYESIKRKRQHKLLVLRLIENLGVDDNLKYIIQNLDKHSAKIFYTSKKGKEDLDKDNDNELISLCADLVKLLQSK